ncbi:MAG: double-strand break repair protein AddB [Rhodospirillales bacterium]
MRPGPGVWSIPPGRAFTDALADGLSALAGDDPLALAAVTVLLPSRRAGRALRDAFLRRSDGRPLLLPRMLPLGEADADELRIVGGVESVPPVAELRRRLLIARLVLRREDVAALPGQAVALAGELARLIDEVATERADWAGLAGLAPADFAEHWQRTIAFLSIVTELWPVVLAEEGAVDPGARRDALLARQAERWRAAPPDGWIVAAGSTGTNPAALDLLEVVAGLPKGMVVLPGLDRYLDGEGWDAVGDDLAHPMHGLWTVLRRLGLDRAAVREWPETRPGDGGAAEPLLPLALPTEDRSPRAVLLSEAMRPAATTDAWRSRPAIPPDALDGVRRIDCAGAQEEAATVALLMREALETPGKTCALVTPDRSLARRVAAALRRWDILVDDSAGRPLPDTPVGTYLRLVAEAAMAQAAPVALLTLLKHPLAAGGMAPVAFRDRVRALELGVLRGPRPGPGFDGLRHAIAGEDARFGHGFGRADLLAFVDGLERGLGPLTAAMAGPDLPLADLLRLHMEAAERLADAPDTPGALRLWRHDDGEAAATLIAELQAAAHDFPAVAGADYPPLFVALTAGVTVRPRFGLHPRLHVLGLLEARLQRFDRMILGGLSEGTWPADPAADPWMSRPMRIAFGLPAAERTVGLAAHDFVQAAAAPEVFLTRAEKVGGAPTVPSRWLTRLDTALTAAGLDPARLRDGRARGWATALDTPDAVSPAPAPAPRPPAARRPRALSVTEIGTWMRDPYAIYARHVLRLRALDPLEAEPDAADRGTILHTALDAVVREPPAALPADALARLIAAGRAAFGDALARPEVHAFWWPRFERVAVWFLEEERRRRAAGIVNVRTEATARLVLERPGGPFALTGKADRIDRMADGRLVIVDYKTGTLPKATEILAGLSPQLPLEAAMAAAGAFADVDPAPVAEIAFWSLKGTAEAGRIEPVKGDPADLGAQALAGLAALVDRFDDVQVPYRPVPRPAFAPRFSDYGHLARVAEWSVAAGGEE